MAWFHFLWGCARPLANVEQRCLYRSGGRVRVAFDFVSAPVTDGWARLLRWVSRIAASALLEHGTWTSARAQALALGIHHRQPNLLEVLPISRLHLRI